MKPKPYYKFGIQHGIGQGLHAFVKTALREVRPMYGFEPELWEAECLAEFHIACSEFIST